ncbi:hypothetical protein HETIRDRAFT_461100 [Heterobasidion irregulare TC 32-1]|uniref:Uncharacterized protein n=1 Tax=Heterobasidion irregulare (strain TC 32-1) TaxID=747525 RepID=W4JT02_HETIT|nr:uncharacterized protein HETIRDRAFT_461100 [Heterobasidion irregulare TC 32-1]ETW75996.1 hypothetical protein HETIRDRAFT_461100 [Heterobasidion irregulare TC 32-1]
MSLLSDPEFLVHSLRLNYLRNVDDPYGPRLISLNPSFSSNPYIVAASFADVDRWPELSAPSSPPLSEDEADGTRIRHASGFPGATGLRYTQTILGPSRTGFMGMRTGDRRSGSARRSTRYAKRDEERNDDPPKEAGGGISSQLGSLSSDGEDLSAADDEDDFDDVGDIDNSIDMDGDEFDTHSHLSPVNECSTIEGMSSDASPFQSEKPIDSYFEMVTPPPVKTEDQSSDDRSPENPGDIAPVAADSPLDDLFARQEIVLNRPAKSALSSFLASSNTTNPFSDLYSSISGRGVPTSAATTITIFFPHAREPAGKPMELNVRKDATMEEVLGFALWNYWEEDWQPRLGEKDESDDTLSAVGWVLRIAEDDGEVDEDFPPPDRTGKISKFNFDVYAVLEATPIQIQQNKVLESKIQRSPSRVATKVKKPEGLTVAGLTIPGSSGPGTSAILGSTLGNSLFSSSLGPSPSYGPQMFLRIRVLDTADAVHISTTIPVSATMYMQEALEMVCRKRKLQNAKEYALLLGDMSILIPLDRTVASLQGKSDLMLVKRSMLPRLGVDVGRMTGKTTDPNASIFKSMSDVPEAQYSLAGDYTSAYKKYTVYRKMPMLVGRHERTLAIDGAYIHIMPSSNKAKVVFESGKTSSYHINSIIACQQSAKSSSSFRFIVHRDGGNKRYEFEAESPILANEIVQIIRGLKTMLERSGTINKSRRSKQVG